MNIDILLSGGSTVILKNGSLISELDLLFRNMARVLGVSKIDPKHDAVITACEVYTSPGSEEIQIRINYDPKKLFIFAKRNKGHTEKTWVQTVLQLMKEFLEKHSLNFNVCCLFCPCPGARFGSTVSASAEWNNKKRTKCKIVLFSYSKC